MRQFPLCGQNWIAQFIYGFDIAGTFSQKHVFPYSKKRVSHPADMGAIWSDVEERFCARSRCSGFPKYDHLRGEASDQVSSGWLSPPLPLSPSVRFLSQPDMRINAAFRFPVLQLDKIRACDDLKYGRVYHCAADVTPIKLPTWDHISQMFLKVAGSATDWPFFKADRDSAYKNLPLNPDQSHLAVVTLRSPDDDLRYGFAPRTLLFGASAAVQHYNCFPG